MKATVKLRLIAMMIIFVGGFFLISLANASGRNKSPDIIINIPETGGECTGVAAAMASGQHQFFITEKSQISISGAYYGDCEAFSAGSAFSHGDTLYSGQITCDSEDCGGGVSATIKF